MDKDTLAGKEYYKTMPFMKKVEHFFVYNWEKCLAGLLIVFVMAVGIYYWTHQVSDDMTIYMFASNVLEDNTEVNLEEYLSGMIEDADGDESLVVSVNDYSATMIMDSNEPVDDVTAVSIQKLEMVMVSGEAKGLIADEGMKNVIIDRFGEECIEKYAVITDEEVKAYLGVPEDEDYYYFVKKIYREEEKKPQKAKMHENANLIFEKITK